MQLNFYKANCLCKIDDFCDICNLYNEIINIGLEVKEKQVLEAFNSTDESELEEYCNKLELFKYRMELLLLCCLSETWEQNLHVLLIEALKTKEDCVRGKLDSDYLKVCGKKENVEKLISEILIDNNYNNVKRIYKYIFDIDIDAFSSIKEMRNFVNAIKHGVGRSLDSLKNNIGDSLFLNSTIGELSKNGETKFIKEFDIEPATLLNKTIHTEGLLQKYLECIKDSWSIINDKLFS